MGSGFRIQGSGFRVYGLGSVQCSPILRDWGFS